MLAWTNYLAIFFYIFSNWFSSKIKWEIFLICILFFKNLGKKMCHKVKISTYIVHVFYFKSYCEDRIKALVVLLLPDEQSESVKQTATEISTRLSQEKVHSWINKHITVRKYNIHVYSSL